MPDPKEEDAGYGSPNEYDVTIERPEASESGVITQMEHRRSESMSSVDLRFLSRENDRCDGGDHKKKGRRLSTRVARGIKKQFTSDNYSRPRSMSPPRSSRRLANDDAREISPLRRMYTDTAGSYEPKKKHKSKFKPVAKAAAHAAKKMVGKKASTAHAHPQRVESGKTPMSIPLNGSALVDRAAVDGFPQELPDSLSQMVHQETEAEDYAEKSMAVGEGPTLEVTAREQLRAQVTPTEDEALKLAQAMAMAVQSNPTKSQGEIRRLVYNQPEFKHLAPPEVPAKQCSASHSTSKLLKSNFSSIKKQITSGAGTAQKKFLEMAETNLGSSISNFSFVMTGGSSTGSNLKAHHSASTMKASARPTGVSPSLSVASTSSLPSVTSNATQQPVGTIPEDSQLTLEHSTLTAKMSQSSLTCLAAAGEATATTEDAAAVRCTPQPDSTIAVGSAGSKKWRELPIKITDIVWKRRSGFGKFSTDAWERRRFILQGNVLSYYRAKGNSIEPMEDETELLDEGRRNIHAPGTDTTKPAGNSSKASTKQRMFDYMEQVAYSAGLAPALPENKTEEDKKSSARGYMDLIKENAVICATLGHSGAPSPFCLSIKVEGVTKWKLCFSSHRSQLQWMAAISDVIVQASVDIYNVKLLTKADPTNIDPTQAFQATVYEPPGSDEQPSSQNSMQHTDGEDDLLPQPSLHVSGKRLWIMEPYIIKPQNNDDDSNGASIPDSSSSFEEGTSEEEDAQSPSTTGKRDNLDDSDIWSLPGKNLLLAAAIINASILLTRNSAMSVQSFWSVVTIANMSLFAFLESRPGRAPTPDFLPPSHCRTRRSKKRRARRCDVTGDPEYLDKDARAAGAKSEKDEPYMPMAGMSGMRIEKPEDSMENANGDKFSRWCQVDGETIQVRSHGYMTTKAKIPSPGSLYELIQCDIFESPSRYPDMAPRVKLPHLDYEIDPNEEKMWKSPDHFVVSLSLPTDQPKLGAATSDGGGYTVTMYFTMRKTTRDILRRVTAEGYQVSSEERPEDIQKSQVNAVRLFEEWCRRAPNDTKFQTRFKMVPNVVNAKEIGLPSWIGKYNGKPLLIKRPGQTGFLIPHPELSCIEFDISLHVFPYLAKQGICYLKDSMFSKLLATVGFVIEGRDDDELPEVLIGLAQICYPDPQHIMQGAGFFAGTAPRSYEPKRKTVAQAHAEPAADYAPAVVTEPVPGTILMKEQEGK